MPMLNVCGSIGLDSKLLAMHVCAVTAYACECEGVPAGSVILFREMVPHAKPDPHADWRCVI